MNKEHRGDPSTWLFVAPPPVVPSDIVAELLGGFEVLRARIETFEDLSGAVNKGLPVDAIQKLAFRLNLEVRVLEQILRLKGRLANLDLDESDRVVRFAAVVAKAEYRFRDRVKAGKWLTSPNDRLDGKRPLDLLGNEAGVRHIEQLLHTP